MLGPLVFVKLKAAEEALRAGRLEEAYEQVASGEIREHKRAQAVLAGLADAFLARAREHEKAGRYAEALLDLNRAAASGAGPAQVAELRQWVVGVAEREHNLEQARRRQIEAAKQRIDAGSLDGGREILADLDVANTQVQRLAEQADLRERAAERSLADARRFVQVGQFGPACRSLEAARVQNPKADGLLEMEAEIVHGVIDRVREALGAGRLETGAELLAQLGEVGRGLPERSEWERILDDIRTAAQAVSNADWATARRVTLRLKTRLPDAEWVAQAAEQLERIDDLVTAVHAGPLGAVRVGEVRSPFGPPSLKDGAFGPAHAEETEMMPRSGQEPPRQAPPAVRVGPSTRWQLFVDGAGTFLMIARHRVTIGRAGSDAVADIALPADLASIHAEIARIDDDYFLFAPHPVRVNGRPVTQRLLEDGDRIELSPRARPTFRLPSRRSASAVLDLGGSLRLAGDVRRVILFDRHATMGPGPANHIVVPGAYGMVAIFERAGNLCVRPTSDRGAESPGAEALVLADGAPVELAGMRMVMRVQS